MKVYKSHTGNPNAELTLVQLGEKDEKRVLAYFKTPDFAIDREYNVYTGQCQTTRCETMNYRVIGGKSINFVSNSGYFGDYYELLLPGRNKPLVVYYDEKLSVVANKDDIYNKYLTFVGRNFTGSYNADAVEDSLNSALKEVQLACKSTVHLNDNVVAFRQSKLVHLIGMGRYYLKEIALKCADVDYQAELSKIKTISLLPAANHEPIALKGTELFVYLSEATYNPKYEAQLWLEDL